MEEKSGKKQNRVLRIVFMVLSVVIAINLAGYLINFIFFSNELASIAPYGRLVDVDGGKMHVYSMGKGKRTIVILPGMGVPLPCADFGPLMRLLSGKYTVVCIEYFGYGFSGKTGSDRTVGNIVNEVREALKTAGFEPPYILMPHSVSGIYSEYYAAKYPREVSGIVMLDTTSTGKKVSSKDAPPRFLLSIAKIQQACGLTRLAAALAKPAQQLSDGYTAKEINDYRLFVAHAVNDNLLDQITRTGDDINTVYDMPFPGNIPVLKIISAQTLKTVGGEYQDAHLKRLGKSATSEIIDASHFIYQTRSREINAMVFDFMARIK